MQAVEDAECHDEAVTVRTRLLDLAAMKKALLFVVPLSLIAIALGLWWAKFGPDRFDYAAAFETQPAAEATDPAAAIPLASFAGRTRDEVREQLGEPRRCEQGTDSERCVYDSLRVQITYIGGKADWITIPLYDVEDVLAPQTLARFGLPVRDPDVSDANSNLWRNLGGYREVRLSGGEGTQLLFVKVTTP